MKIVEAFGKAVNLSIHKGIDKALKFLELSEKELEDSIKSKKLLANRKSFDIAVDYKPKINQLYLYICPKKASKKLVKSLKPDEVDFKSMIIFLGGIKLFGRKTEVRLGALGASSSELVKATIKYKK